MDTLAVTLIAPLLQDLGGSNFIAAVVLIIAAIVYIRKTNLESATSLGRFQREQVGDLVEQINTLSKELKEAREELTVIHTQNIQLLEEICEANIQIRDLEDQIKKLGQNQLRNRRSSDRIKMGRRAKQEDVPTTRVAKKAKKTDNT